MRLDHIAYRVSDREKTTEFFKDCLGYQYVGTYSLEFDDGSTTEFNMLAPPEDRPTDVQEWSVLLADVPPDEQETGKDVNFHAYHAPPEIAVSEGPAGSIVGDWVARTNGGNGGVHHIAYEVEDVAATMKYWSEKHGVEFYSDEPLVCEEDDLVQVFSKPSPITGVIYELITRGKDNKGFCVQNVKALMNSTKEI